MLALPPRLWRAQLSRLGLLSLAIFVLTAIGADGVPPVTQARAPLLKLIDRAWGSG